MLYHWVLVKQTPFLPAQPILSNNNEIGLTVPTAGELLNGKQEMSNRPGTMSENHERKKNTS